MLPSMTKNMLKLLRICTSNRSNIALAVVYIPCLVGLMTGIVRAQVSEPATSVQLSSSLKSPQSQIVAAAPQAITFSDALSRARANNPQMQAAITAAGLAHEDLVQSRAALLPNVTYNMSAIYTQPTPGTTAADGSPIFAANNGVHEYIAQGNVHQNLSLQTFADFGRASAARAVARARSEIAVRGLAVTVAQAFYGYLAAQHKYETQQRANEEAQRFLGISQKLEQGGEVAHSDVIKAQLQAQQQKRDLREGELAKNKARLDLAVLLFRDFNENFTIADDLTVLDPLPSLEEATAAGSRNNPDLRAAQASFQQAGREVIGAWGGVLPSISLDYWYGIDSSRFATRANGVSTLGTAKAATLQLPLWSWGANISRVKQANLQKRLAEIELSATQRTLLANLRTFYDEAQAARAELDLLDQSVQLATESLRLINLRYQGGESSVLEVVDAQNTLTQASNAYHDGLVRFRVATANVQTLTGKF
jgi:outer membrane protein TolC